MEEDKVVEDELFIDSAMIEKEKYLKFIKKGLLDFIIFFIIAFIGDNLVYCDYIFHQEDYKLCEGKIEKINLRGRSGKELFITYNLEGTIYEGTTMDHNLGDSVGDEIIVIVKGDLIGRNQIVIGRIVLRVIIGFILFLVICFHKYIDLKKIPKE